MKKFIFISAILVAAFTLSFHEVSAKGKEFTGVIVYNVTYSGDNITPQMLSMMPKTMVQKIKGEMSRVEMNMGMGQTIVIYNGEDKSGVTLMDMMGQKYAMKMSATDIEKEITQGPDVKVEQTDEVKEIAGYKCKKAILTFKEEGATTESQFFAFYTDELGSGKINSDNPLFKDIQGVMLEYTAADNGIIMSFSAVSVDKKKLSDDEFQVPEGYKEISREELESMFGG